jgi:formate hydrogenlyase transcriptional activator
VPNELAVAPGLIPFAYPEAMTQPEKLLAAYFGSTTVGLAVMDPQFRYLALNNALAEINGIPAHDHLGKTTREILGDLAGTVEAEMQRAISTREPVSLVVSAVLPTRTETGYWMVHYVPIPNDAGAVTRVGAVVVEITAQKKLEESLQHSDGKLRQGMHRMEMLLDVSSIIASHWSLSQVFPRISARIRRVFYHEYAGVEFYDAATGKLVRKVEDFPFGKGLLSAEPISASDSPGGRSLRERTPMIFSSDQMQGFTAEITKNFLAEGLRSLCCVPLLRPTGPLGVLIFGSTRENAFHSEDLTLLNQVAAQLAVAIENQRSASELKDLKERVVVERKYLEGEILTTGEFSEIVGDSSALKQALNQVITVAPTEATVLVLGETGTGKELIARAVHRLSSRRAGPFIKVNCAAIPTGLLESELFGHEKGAFTGAISQKVGRVELAHGGTLFLDEVGEIPLELQPKLLRMLQDQEFERLGSNRTIKVNLRLVTATNRDLAKAIEQHEFRSDLFYRLNVFPICSPPLRERPEDIPLLVRYYVLKFSQRMGRNIETIPRETIKALSEWHWPGNVRELENLMERSVILSEGNVLRVPLAELKKESPSPVSETNRSLDNAEREHILRVLREVKGVFSGPDGAARRLGLKRTTLQSKMLRLKISRSDYSSPQRM